MHGVNCMRFGVLTAVNSKIVVFCNTIYRYQRLEECVVLVFGVEMLNIQNTEKLFE
jgi:hypothetical protein